MQRRAPFHQQKKSFLILQLLKPSPLTSSNTSLHPTHLHPHHYSPEVSCTATNCRGKMERRLSLGSSINQHHRQQRDQQAVDNNLLYGQATNFLGNPSQRPRVAEKIVWAPEEIQQRRGCLLNMLY
jgi:hypothetical protein